VALVSGSDDQSAHGFAVGAYLAQSRGVVMLSGTDTVPAETRQAVAERSADISRVDVCGPDEQGSSRVGALLGAGDLPEGFGEAKLAVNSKGADVEWLEQRLTDLSYRPGAVDGVFDKRTRHAVIAFQKWEGLKRDGIVQSDVWWALLGAERPTAQQTAEPSGLFHISRENTRERLRYKPLYLRSWGVFAIHGYTKVPPYPASHGCIRITWADMDEFHSLIPVGTAVYIY
jgi:hypothetical protein